MIRKGAVRLQRWLATRPRGAAEELRLDRRGLPRDDPGAGCAMAEAVAWLARAQDHSASRDGGVARHFGLLDGGWAASYPETTGYIIPTLLDYARHDPEADAALGLRDRARRMLDWLASIQLPCGGFQGGVIGQTPVVPVTFNTGQIVLGLAAGVRAFGEVYLGPMTRAADWLVDTQDADGCWRRHPTPFAAPGEKAYETHAAWGLLEADRAVASPRHRDAALANLDWALTHQRPNGWFDRCCLNDPERPLTHTLGYAVRGLLEGHRTSGAPRLLTAAAAAADGALNALGPDGFLPGRLDARWQPAAAWSCLTGTLQFAACWLLLAEATGLPRYRSAATRANQYVRRTLRLAGPPGVRGGVKGAFPIDGAYGAFEYLSWAAKFLVDAHLLEAEAETSAAVDATAR